jgi:hypothetical protein
MKRGEDYHARPTTFDFLVSELCERMDRLKEDLEFQQRETEYWKNEYQQLSKGYHQSLQDSVGQLLSLVIRAEDTPEGVLIHKDPIGSFKDQEDGR